MFIFTTLKLSTIYIFSTRHKPVCARDGPVYEIEDIEIEDSLKPEKDIGYTYPGTVRE